MHWWRHIWLCCLVILPSLGCTHVISDSLRRQAETSVSLSEVRARPEAYRDRLVILGGDIARVRNTPEGTLLEVVQKPLDASGAPQVTDRTAGRFLALCAEYLDPAVYAPERRITVAGRLQGTRTAPLDEIEYTYPVVSCLELHLWPEPVQVVPRYPLWYWDDPWYWPQPYFHYPSLHYRLYYHRRK